MSIVGALLLILVATVLPTVVYVFMIWWLDRYEKEPWGMLIAAFLWGSIPAIIASLIIELVADVPLAQLGSAYSEFASTALVAPITEEVVKGVLLFIFFMVFRREFDDTLDGIVYGALVGAGFAMTENLLYYLGAFFGGGGDAGSLFFLIGARGIIFGLNHSLFTSVTGAALGTVRYTPGIRRVVIPIFGLAGAITLHIIHNTAASFASVFCWSLALVLLSDWGGVIVIVVIAIMSLRREQQWIINELGEEINYGILNEADLRNAASWRRRWAVGWNVLTRRGFGTYRMYNMLFQLLTELAFKKHQYRTLGEEHGNLEEIQSLRSQIINLRQRINVYG